MRSGLGAECTDPGAEAWDSIERFNPALPIDLKARSDNHLPSMKRHLPLVILVFTLLFAPGCATHLQKKEAFLKEAGFRLVKPQTPAQIAHLQSLRQGHITHETRNGQTLYILADARKNQLLIGGDTEYERYQEILYARVVDPDTAGAKFTQGLEKAWNTGWGSVLGSLVPQ